MVVANLKKKYICLCSCSCLHINRREKNLLHVLKNRYEYLAREIRELGENNISGITIKKVNSSSSSSHESGLLDAQSVVGNLRVNISRAARNFLNM